MLAIRLARWVHLLFDVFTYLLLARVVFSFIRLGRDANPLLVNVQRFVYRVTEPVLAPVRNVVKPVPMGGGGYMDFSPLIVIILLPIVRNLIINLIIFIF